MNHNMMLQHVRRFFSTLPSKKVFQTRLVTQRIDSLLQSLKSKKEGSNNENLVSVVREYYGNNRLTPEQVRDLELHGMDWGEKATVRPFIKKAALGLKTFKTLDNNEEADVPPHFEIPKNSSTNWPSNIQGFRLGYALQVLQSQYREEKLSSRAIRVLEDAGMEWTTSSTSPKSSKSLVDKVVEGVKIYRQLNPTHKSIPIDFVIRVNDEHKKNYPEYLWNFKLGAALASVTGRDNLIKLSLDDYKRLDALLNENSNDDDSVITSLDDLSFKL